MSLIALNCLGHTYPVNPSLSDSQLNPLMHHTKTTQILSTRFEDDLHYDMSTVDKLRELEESKKEAVAQGNFERAIQLREAISRMQEVGRRLNELVAKKRTHMEKQEYHQAQRVKQEIDQIRMTLTGSKMMATMVDNR